MKICHLYREANTYVHALANRECDSHNVCAVYDDTCLLQLKQMLAGVIRELY